jgi:hypothetical protein
VVIYADAPEQGVWTVVTETRGPRGPVNSTCEADRPASESLLSP